MTSKLPGFVAGDLDIHNKVFSYRMITLFLIRTLTVGFHVYDIRYVALWNTYYLKNFVSVKQSWIFIPNKWPVKWDNNIISLFVNITPPPPLCWFRSSWGLEPYAKGNSIFLYKRRCKMLKYTLNQCCGSSIFFSMRIGIKIQGFDDQKLEKIYSCQNVLFIFLIKNCNLLIPRPP
jgi:hypothetical protein